MSNFLPFVSIIFFIHVRNTMNAHAMSDLGSSTILMSNIEKYNKKFTFAKQSEWKN